MISFYPGPSRVYTQVSRYLQEAHKEGIMSINHRSEVFEAISRKAVTLLKEKLSIPADYAIYFVSSATECWEIIAQSLTRQRSTHIYNGAFGKKWYDYARRLRPDASDHPFDLQTSLNPDELKLSNSEVICITQNETANGTQVSNRIIQSIKKNNPHAVVAVDATSSMAGIRLNFESADVWFASVQKCFGLPAGLGLLVCSPDALKQASALNERLHYNSLLLLDDMMQKYQTSCTPNILNIYLLMRVMEEVKPIDKIDKTIKSRYKKWAAFFDTKTDKLNFLISNKQVRSNTVLTIAASPHLTQRVKTEANKAGFLLGEGYGELRATTLRIANFPAIKRTEIARLMDFLYDFI
jgi:phosphoserine aminotransferase